MVIRDRVPPLQPAVVAASRRHTGAATAFHDAERRRRVIDAAEAIFLVEGYRATTMDEVARRAGMSKKTLYQVFPTKEVLFEALLADRMKILHLPIEDTNQPIETALADLLCRTAEFLLGARQIAMARLMISEYHRSPALTEALARAIPASGRISVARWLTLQCSRGNLTLDDPERAAGMLIGMVAGDWLFGSLLGKIQPPTKAEIATRVERAIGIFLRGIQESAVPPPRRSDPGTLPR